MRYSLHLTFGLLLLSAGVLLTFSYGKKPVGYIHSWNQITTLSHIRAIGIDFSMWNKPLDVVTRLSAHPEPVQLLPEPPYSHFRIYEEFPLYHVLSSFLYRGGFSPEDSARIFSLVSFILAGIGIYFITAVSGIRQAAFMSTLLWSISLPVLYYSQATMSDMSMTAFAIWSMYFFIRYNNTGSFSHAAAGLGLLTVSSLFKSYSIVYLLSWCFLFFRKKHSVQGIILCTLCAFPVFFWHGWTLFQSGHQEIASHALNEKLATLFSADFYHALQKYFFRFTGIIPGVIFLIFSAGYLSRIKTNKTSIPFLLPSWLIPSLIYVLFTADKIPDHEYYFLPVSPVIFVISGFALTNLWKSRAEKGLKKYSRLACFIILLSPLPQTFLGLRKSLRENPDVSECSKAISEITQQNDIIGFNSDVSRYNSLAYYSNRMGLVIEGKHFPLSKYLDYGISHIAINLPEQESEEFSEWIEQQKNILSEKLLYLEGMTDFKSRERTCAVWKIGSRN